MIEHKPQAAERRGRGARRHDGFAWAAAIFALGAVIAAALSERGTKALAFDASIAPATAH